MLGRRALQRTSLQLWNTDSRSTGAIRAFSVLNRPPPNYEGHVPLTGIEKACLAAGSAVASLIDPRRGGIDIQLVFKVHSTEC